MIHGLPFSSTITLPSSHPHVQTHAYSSVGIDKAQKEDMAESIKASTLSLLAERKANSAVPLSV
jgi:hypothetical protein